MPPAVLAETAFDAFAHAVEGSVSGSATEAGRARGRRAVELIAAHLPGVLRGEGSPAAQEALCLASVLGGLNVGTASTCLPHRLQQAMGSLPGLNISHGRGLAVVYPSRLRHTEAYAPDEFAALAGLLGGDDIHTAVERLLASSGLSARLRDRGVDRDGLDVLVGGVSGNLANDPASAASTAYLRELFAESL